RSNIDAQVMRYLKVGFDVNARLEKNHLPSLGAHTLFNRIQRAKPTAVAFYPNGLPGFGPVGANPAIITTDKAGWNDERNKLFGAKLSGDLDLSWITNGLSFKGLASYRYLLGAQKVLNDTWDVFQYNSETKEYDKGLGKTNENQNFTDLTQTES